MEPDKQRKFNFGTGEIDVDQWLRDIDAGLPDYYDRMSKAYHKKENEEVRNAMTDLIGRISSGDMLSRSADGTYNFKSQLYSPNRGKYTRWAYQTALSYLGGKGRGLITPIDQKEELKESTAKKNIYSTQSLLRRFNNSVQRGSTQLDLGTTWWGTATPEDRAKHLYDFLNKEAAYIKTTDDIDEAYKDLGKEGLATSMSTLAQQILANPNGDYGRQFGNLGMNNILKATPISNQGNSEQPTTVDQQIAKYQQDEIDHQKEIQLNWYKNKGKDSYYNGNQNFFDQAVNKLNAVHNNVREGKDIQTLKEKEDNKPVWFNEGATFISKDGTIYKINGTSTNEFGKRGQWVKRSLLSDGDLDLHNSSAIGAVVGRNAQAKVNYRQHFVDTNKSVSQFLQRLGENWESLFAPNSQGLTYTNEGSQYTMTPQQLWEGLAQLTYTMPTGDTESTYVYTDDKQKPIDVGNGLLYIPGTYRQTGDVLLFDTYNKRLVKSNILKYSNLASTLGSALYEKEGGVLKLQSGRYVPPVAAINYNTPKVVSQEPTYESTKNPSQEVKFTSAEKARLYSSIADIGSIVVAFAPGYGTAASALLGLGSTATNFGADLADGYGYLGAAKNAGIGLAADVMGLIPGLGSASKGAKVAKNLLWAVPKITQWLNTIDGLSNANELIASIKKIPHPSTMTLDDWNNVRQAVQIVSGHGRSVATKVKKSAMVKHKVNTVEPQYEIKTTDGWKPVSDDTYNQLKNVRSVSARNKLSEKLLGTGVKLEHKNYNPFNTSQRFGIFRYTPGEARIEVKGKRNHWWGDENLVEGVENFNFKKINFKNPYSKYYNVRTQPNIPERNSDQYMLNRINEISGLQVKRPLPWPDVKPKVKPAETVKPAGTVEHTQNNKKNNKSNKKNKKARKHELGGYFKFLRTGGVIVKYQVGGQTGVKFKQRAGSWFNDIFSTYKDVIINKLNNSTNIDADIQWLNGMQKDHSSIYNKAKNTDWQTTAFKDDDIEAYQKQYIDGGGFTDDSTNGFNRYGITTNWGTRYELPNKPTSGDHPGQFTPDKLYSAITDDRRLLGRDDDWVGYEKEFEEFNSFLKGKNFEMKKDPSDGYYYIYKINNSDQNSKDPNVEKPGSQEKENRTDPNPQPQLNKPFDPRALYILGRGASTILGNDWLYDRIYDRLPGPVYKDFIDRKLDTIGDYSALAFAGNRSADLRRIQQLRQVSDQSLNINADYETNRINTEGEAKAKLQDDTKQATTHEAALEMDLKDLEDRRNTAWYNRAAFNEYLGKRADILNARDKARVDATLGMVNNLTALGTSKYLEQKNAYDQAKGILLREPRETAIERIKTEYPELYEKVYSGKDLTNQDIAKYNQLLSKYQEEARIKYARDYYASYGGTLSYPKKQHGTPYAQKGTKLNFIKSLRS